MEKIIPAFILYLTLFRLAIIAAGIVSIVLGYKLFVRGIWPDRGGGTEVEAKVGGSQFTLKNAAPGSVFALFGVIIIAVMFASGSPELTLEMLQNAAKPEKPGQIAADSSLVKLTLRGDASDSLHAALTEAIRLQNQGDTTGAIAAYRAAIKQSSLALNQYAWLSQAQGKLDEALAAANVAVIVHPDDADIQDTYAEILFKKGEYAQALKHVEIAARLKSAYRQKIPRFRRALEQNQKAQE